jgi:hypothetical protein
MLDNDDDNGLSKLLWMGSMFLLGAANGWLKSEFGEDNAVSQIVDGVVEGMTGVDTRS